MTQPSHPLLDRLLRNVGASADAVPSPEAWRALLALVARTYRDADQDRYTIERAMDISSQEMQELYQEVRRRAEQEFAVVRQSNERHRLLFDGNPLPMWVVDAETLQFVDVNEAMTRTYGYDRDEFLAMRATDLEAADDGAPLALMIAGTAAGTTVHPGLGRHRRKNGSVLEMDVTLHALAFDGRHRLLGVALDMTQSRRVEEDLRQAQKMEAIGRLAGGVAHDFNNLLAVILANAEFALAELGEDHDAAAGITEINNAAERAAGLTRQLLTFSRKQRRQPEPVALNSIVTRIEAMLTRIVGEDVTMAAMIAPDLGTIEADPGEVEQILMNLVVNARDAMPGGGRLLLETCNSAVDEAHGLQIGVAAGDYVVLAVSDTGCGMTEEVRVRIFEPFFTTKDVDKGTGLGLATVFGIVKGSQGGISVYSEPGHGATFRIYWPRIDAPVTTAAKPRFVPPRGTGTVLVVEDDPQLRQILRRHLTSWGYTLLEAARGAAALDLVRDHGGPIDLLLTDLVMPGMNGRALSERVLVDRPETRVVFMSGYTEHAALNHAALGPDEHFVQKPFSARALSETLERALAGPPAVRRRRP